MAAPAPVAGSRPTVDRRRLVSLMAAGLVDSFCLSMAWTVVVLEVTAAHGLLAAGLCSTAMLVGIALSAPAASWMARHMGGRHLLRTAAGVEAVLRLGVFVLLVVEAPLVLLAVCVTVMNVVAWTGYAGMRAEVAAASNGAVALTWYGTVVAAVEALGVAVGAFLPTGGDGRTTGVVVVVVTVVYVGALLPTIVVAGGSRVPAAGPRFRRAAGVRHVVGLGAPRPPRPTAATVHGSLLMMLASGPTLLAVPLAAEMHGRAAVGAAAVAFTLGSLVAPAAAARLESRDRNRPGWWVLLAVGMVLGWSLASMSLVWLCVAQVASGLCMTALEGLTDSRAARDLPGEVTAALARVTAGRALGASAGTALLPVAVAALTLSGAVGAVLAALGTVALLQRVAGRHLVPTPSPSPVPTSLPAATMAGGS